MGAAWRWPQWEVLRSAAGRCLLRNAEQSAIGWRSRRRLTAGVGHERKFALFPKSRHPPARPTRAITEQESRPTTNDVNAVSAPTSLQKFSAVKRIGLSGIAANSELQLVLDHFVYFSFQCPVSLSQLWAMSVRAGLSGTSTLAHVPLASIPSNLPVPAIVFHVPGSLLRTE